MPAVEPRGVSWDHPRGHDCMVATAEACKYTAIAPEVGIIPFVGFAAAAWLDDTVNAASANFYQNTLSALDRAYLRPRYNGFMAVQERAGELVHAWLADGGSAGGLLDQLDTVYRRSEPEGKE